MMKGVIVDILGAAGISSIGYGCWLIYPPAAFLCVGSLVLVLAVAAGRNIGKTDVN